MTAIEFILQFWDWYLLVGMLFALRWFPDRSKACMNDGKSWLLLPVTFIWDVVVWPSDLIRKFT